MVGEDLLASGSNDGTIKVWNWRTGRVLRTMTSHYSSALSLRLVGEHRLACGSEDGLISVWNLADASAWPVELRGHTGAVRALELLEDGRRLASASDDGTVKIWRLAAEDGSDDQIEAEQTLSGHTAAVVSLEAISADKLASGSLDGTVRVWELDDGECVRLISIATGQTSIAAVGIGGNASSMLAARALVKITSF